VISVEERISVMLGFVTAKKEIRTELQEIRRTRSRIERALIPYQSLYSGILSYYSSPDGGVYKVLQCYPTRKETPHTTTTN
jgi:hypothetical protein